MKAKFVYVQVGKQSIDTILTYHSLCHREITLECVGCVNCSHLANIVYVWTYTLILNEKIT